jgi:hypothetical protein
MNVFILRGRLWGRKAWRRGHPSTPPGGGADAEDGSSMLEVGLPEIDSLDYYNNWMLMAGYAPNPDLIMKFAQNSGTATD